MNTPSAVIALAVVILMVPSSALAQFTAGVCGSLSPAGVLNPDFPLNHASNSKECKQLCRVQGKVCKQVVKSRKCYLDTADAGFEGLKIDCNDEADVSGCKRLVDSDRQSFRASRKATLADEKLDCARTTSRAA